MDPVCRLSNLMNNCRFEISKKVLHLFLRCIYSCDIMPGTSIGLDCRFPHRGLGVVINNNAIIGNKCVISKGVVIGGRGTGNNALEANNKLVAPIIGDNVLIGANAVVIGGIRIGNDSKIGAGAVVVKDVPDGATVIGNPGRIIKIYGKEFEE